MIATGAGHLVFEPLLHLKAAYFTCVGAAWTVYVVRCVRRDPSTLSTWGWRRSGLKPATFCAAAVLVVGAIAVGLAGHSLGHLRFPASMLVLLLAYPVWGYVQQFLLQAFVARNLAALGVRQGFVVPLTALGFGVVHAPEWRLVGACALLGLVFTPIYLRWRNLWPLGLAHAWLGTLAFYWLLGRDPWVEFRS